jgi:phenol 2-monooxygenase
MVRMYVQLDEENAKRSASNDPEITLGIAKRILEPYSFDTRSIYWSTKYSIQQLLASSYSAFDDRVFIMGDAAHTHSPKAGMGLNMGIQDAYNLAWKLAAVVKKEAKREILATYELERRPIARELLEFDRDFNTLFHSPLADCTPEQYRTAIGDAVTKESGEISGVAAQYLDPEVVAQPGYCCQHLASGVSVGRRVPRGKFVNHSNGTSTEIHDVLSSNGKWSLFTFPGDLRDPTARKRFWTLGQQLQEPNSPLHCFRQQEPDSSMVEVFTVHSCPRHEMPLLDLPDIFHPWHPELGWDYGKVFTDEGAYQDLASTGHLYRDFGIADEGCVLLLRPDHHVCLILRIEDAVELCTQYLGRWFYRNSGNGVCLDPLAASTEGRTIDPQAVHPQSVYSSDPIALSCK